MDFLAAIDEVNALPNTHYWPLLVRFPAFNQAAFACIDVAERALAGERVYGEDVQPLLFESYGNLRGASLARSHLDPPTVYAPSTGGSSYIDLAYDVIVEPGASKLVFGVSDYDATPEAIDEVVLVDPAGTEHYFNSGASNPPNYLADKDGEASLLWSVTNPEPGGWVLLDRNDGGVAPPTDINLYVSALVESSQTLPQCKAFPTHKVYQDGDSVVIRVEASYERPIQSGATFTGFLFRPDGIVSRLEFGWNPIDRSYEAKLGPSALCGRGRYTVFVQFSVAGGSRTIEGERFGLPPEELWDDSLVVPGFRRDAMTRFFVQSATECPLPGTNADEQDETIYTDRGLTDPGLWYVDPFRDDADGDGIPNTDEPDADLDGDGVVDARDSDANNNQVPDGVDPELPYGPASNGTGAGCSPWNSSQCCGSIGACVGGVSGIALYAENQLMVQNGAQIVTDTGFAAIINNGGTETYLAANADVGTVWSHPGVFGSENVQIHGDLRTGGTLYPPQNNGVRARRGARARTSHHAERSLTLSTAACWAVARCLSWADAAVTRLRRRSPPTGAP